VLIPGPTTPQTVTLTLRQADLWGHTADDQGNLVREAKVVVAQQNSERVSDISNAQGFWSIGGLISGTVRLSALPPWPNSGLLPPEPMTITLPTAGNPYTLTFRSSNKIVTGTVQTNAGDPVFHAQVVARRVNKDGQAEALTAADGTYQVQLGPGLWAMTVKVISDTHPAPWVYPQPPQLVFFHFDNQPQAQQQDFTVFTTDASVIGSVQMPDGSPPPFTVTVALHNDEGIGLRQKIEPLSGEISMTVPSGGYKVVIHPASPLYLGPLIDPITVPPHGTFDLSVQKLLAVDAVISGTVTAGGAGVAGIPVVAWRPGVAGSLQTTSGPNGLYALGVVSGTWHVQPAPGALQPYLFPGSGEEVSLASGETIPDINFELLPANATLSGILVDEQGQAVTDTDGWAAAHQVGQPDLHNGAPIQDGQFTIYVPEGTYNVAARLPAGSPYMSSREKQVVATAGQTTQVTLTVQVKDAQIEGALWDPRQQDVVAGVHGGVVAWREANWAAAPIHAGNGAYSMTVAAGLWHINFSIDPEAGYARLAGPLNVAVPSGKTVAVPLPITQKDGTISGTVLAPDGSPLAGAVVLAKGQSAGVEGVWLQARSQPDGSFTLPVPYGRYRLGATSGQLEWVRPVEKLVDVPQNGSSGGHVLQFLNPDAHITGTLTVSNTTLGGNVFVWAWSDGGGYVRGRFPVTYNPLTASASGPYHLDVISNTTWHVGAIFETRSQYWSGNATLAVAGGSATQDILLSGPHAKPGPVVVSFDAADPQQINLADGTQVYIPAGALPVSGRVTLRIEPVATLPHQSHADVLRYGYAFLATDEDGQPIEAQFNQGVVITFSYDEAELIRKHIHEAWLKPAYFSTTTNEWTFPESFVVDTDANRVEMAIDHFTDFALTSSPIHSMFLPLAQR
jgi:hypothetical protein